MTIMGGGGGRKMAHDLSVSLAIPHIEPLVNRFADGEMRIQMPCSLQGQEVILVQSTGAPADRLLELLLLMDAAKGAGSRRVVAVIPYFGYSRQDRQSYKGGPLSAKLMATLLEAAGADHIVTLDFHAPHGEGFFNVGFHNVDPTPLWADAMEPSKDLVVVSPDMGGFIRASKLATLLQTDLALIHKVRRPYDQGTLMGIVRDRDCLLVDDIVDTGETLCKAACLLKEHGAKHIKSVVTHGVFSKGAREKLLCSPIEKMFTTNSLPQGNEGWDSEWGRKRFKVLDSTPMISQALRDILGLKKN